MTEEKGREDKTLTSQFSSHTQQKTPKPPPTIHSHSQQSSHAKPSLKKPSSLTLSSLTNPHPSLSITLITLWEQRKLIKGISSSSVPGRHYQIFLSSISIHNHNHRSNSLQHPRSTLIHNSPPSPLSKIRRVTHRYHKRSTCFTSFRPDDSPSPWGPLTQSTSKQQIKVCISITSKPCPRSVLTISDDSKGWRGSRLRHSRSGW